MIAGGTRDFTGGDNGPGISDSTGLGIARRESFIVNRIGAIKTRHLKISLYRRVQVAGTVGIQLKVTRGAGSIKIFTGDTSFFTGSGATTHHHQANDTDTEGNHLTGYGN